MSNAPRDKKISQFLAGTSLPADAYLTYVSNGTNYKILLSDYLASIGASGTIVQEGDVLATPVLDVDGSVNKIRNLESGSGVLASVSPQNGITIEHNFQEDTTGVELIDDLTADSPVFASLVEGSGIAITKTSNTITVSAADSLANRVVVSSAADLSGTLDSTKEYFIDGVVDMGSQTISVPAGGLTISGYNFGASRLTSSQTGYTMFVSPGGGSGSLVCKDFAIEVTGASSQAFDLTSATSFDAFEFNRINFNNCTSLGELNGFRQGFESGTGRFGGSPNLILSGVWGGGYFATDSIVRSLDAGFAGALYESGAGFAMSSRFRSNQNIDLPASASFFDFAPGDFINPSTVQVDSAIVTRNGVSDATDSNITPNMQASDLAASWSNNVGMPNTFEGGNLNISVAAATTINTQGVFEDLAGTYTQSDLQHFDSPASGQLRHIGNNPREYRLLADVNIQGGANLDAELKVVKWDDSASVFVDVVSQERDINNFVGGADVAFFTIFTTLTLDQNDYVKLQVANNSSTANLTAQSESYFSVIER